MVFQGSVVVMAVYLLTKFHCLTGMLFNQFLYDRTSLIQHTGAVFKGIIHGKIHPVDVLLTLFRMNRKESQTIFFLYLTVPHPVQFPCLLVEIVTDRLPQMPASRMDHNTEEPILIFLKFDKMVASPQASHLIISIFDQWKKFDILFILSNLLLCLIEHLRLLWFPVPLGIERYCPHNTADHSLDQRTVACLDLSYILHPDISRNKIHATSDIYPYRIRYNHILCCDHSADRHSFPGMSVGHQTDPFM